MDTPEVVVMNGQPMSSPAAPVTDDAATNSARGDTAGMPPSRLPRPEPLAQPRRKLDLTLASLPDVAECRPVNPLAVRELKGPGSMFTADLSLALGFRGLVYKPPGTFDTHFQLLAGNLKDNPMLQRRARPIFFIPAFCWSSHDVVLLPLRTVSKTGQWVHHCMRELQRRFPDYKAFIQWDDDKFRHGVHSFDLTGGEREVIRRVTWPDAEAIVEALDVTAFDDLGELCAANEEIKALLTAREVG